MFIKIFFISYHRQGFPNIVKRQGVFPPEVGMGNFAGGDLSQIAALAKIEYLHTGIINTVFQKKKKKNLIFLIYFTVLFYPRYFLDFVMFHILYKIIFFFQKQRNLLSQTSLIFSSFILSSELNFLVDFIKNKKCKKELKFFARIKFWKKGILKLGKN